MFSTLANSLPSSKILATSQAIKQRIAAGEEIDNFTVGDFDPNLFPIPAELEREVIRAYLKRQTNYPAAEGIVELREAITTFAKRFQQLEFTKEEILVAAGGRPLIYALYLSLVDPGDKVIYPVPSWNNHYYAAMTGAVPVEIETTAATQFMPTAKMIAPHLKGATLLALCSPQNPTGTCFEEAELREICQLVVQENRRRTEGKQLTILFDQMYWLLTHGATKHYDPISVCPEVRPYVVYVDAISKAFAATGVRVGWAMGPDAILDKMKIINSHVGAWAPMPEQKATAVYLREHAAILNFQRVMLKAVGERLEKLYNGIKRLKEEGVPIDAIAPQGAIYLAVRIDTANAQEILLNEAGIGILPFSAFGASTDSHWYRISVGTCKTANIKPMLQRLKHALCPAMIA
jgi:aspartate/methionine/tyrosine aminotransferase